MNLNLCNSSFIDIVLSCDKSAHTTEEVSYAQAQADRQRHAEEQALSAERKRKREADFPDHLKAARVRVQKHQDENEQQSIPHEEQTGFESSSQLKLETDTPSAARDATLPHIEQTIWAKETDLTATRIGDEEVIETNVDAEKLDVIYDYMASVGCVSPYRKSVYKIDPMSGARCGYVRSIPNFGVLAFKTISGLPQVLWRVVHSGSAGSVTTSQLGAQLYSQARKVHGTSSDFASFRMEEIADQLKRHINGEKENFSSHWISTTDSFDHAWDKARSHHCSTKTNDVKIYRIDTRTLKRPTLVLPMYGAIKAWSIEDGLLEWRWKMFKYSTLTEWLVWDELDADDVEEIPYELFLRPPQSNPSRSCSSVSKRAPNLMRILQKAAHSASKGPDYKRGRRIPRTAHHKKCYYTPQQEVAIQIFDEQVHVGRFGKLPTAPKVVQDDKRSNISTNLLDDIYACVKQWRSGNLLFIWILSTLTKRFYLEDMVQTIVSRYSNVVSAVLDMDGSGYGAAVGTDRKVLKYDIPGPHGSAKVDVNHYQELMKACIEEWCKVSQKDHSEYSGLDVYYMYGEHQTARRLLLPQEKGLLGRCETVDSLSVQTAGMASVKHPSISLVQSVTKVVSHTESHGECMARRAVQYGAYTKMLAPDVPMKRQLWYDTRKLTGQKAKEKADEMKTRTAH